MDDPLLLNDLAFSLSRNEEWLMKSRPAEHSSDGDKEDCRDVEDWNPVRIVFDNLRRHTLAKNGSEQRSQS